MRAFSCTTCGQLVFFENSSCLYCGAALGFDWDARELVSRARSGPGTLPLQRCSSAAIAACNGLAPEPGKPCFSCRLTRMRPADGDAEGLAAYAVAEAAKRRLLFQLVELGLPVESWREREGGLAFELLSSADRPVTTGHADGVITLDLAESGAAHREQMREQLDEPYRTLLGHFRHEVGHYYWPILVEHAGELTRFRALFGDERADYGEAVDRHYANGPAGDWSGYFVSAYATMHPWEDWAETWAHYLHIWDTTQTAAAYRVQVGGPDVPVRAAAQLTSEPDPDARGVRALLDEWLPLTYTLNAINRSMGKDDLYPFVLSEPVVKKLAFVDEVINGGADGP